MEKSSIRARVYSDGEKSSANENKVFAVTVTKTSKVLPKKDFEWKCGRGEVASSQADISLLSTTPQFFKFFNKSLFKRAFHTIRRTQSCESRKPYKQTQQISYFHDGMLSLCKEKVRKQ
jgi:hypothetical protein